MFGQSGVGEPRNPVAPHRELIVRGRAMALPRLPMLWSGVRKSSGGMT